MTSGLAYLLTREVLGEEPKDWALSLSAESFRRVLELIPEKHRLISMASLRSAIESAALVLIDVLIDDSTPFSLTSAQVNVVRDIVSHDFPFRDMVNGIREVQRHWTETMLELIQRETDADDRVACLQVSVNLLSRFFDDTVDRVISLYLSERQRAMATTVTARLETVSRILRGESIGSDDATLSRLGIDLHKYHLAMVVWTEADETSPCFDEERPGERYAQLEEAVQGLGSSLGSDTVLAVPCYNGTLWGWATRALPFSSELAQLRAQLPVPTGLRFALGRPGLDIAGFRRSHGEARDAHRVAVTGHSREVVTLYSEVELVALLSADLERARSFVKEQLGPLASPVEAMQELRCTLLAYLQAEHSLVSTARDLKLHRNTVVYRLRRIEAVLGRPLSHRCLETYAALELTSRLGPAVLDN